MIPHPWMSHFAGHACLAAGPRESHCILLIEMCPIRTLSGAMEANTCRPWGSPIFAIDKEQSGGIVACVSSETVSECTGNSREWPRSCLGSGIRLGSAASSALRTASNPIPTRVSPGEIELSVVRCLLTFVEAMPAGRFQVAARSGMECAENVTIVGNWFAAEFVSSWANERHLQSILPRRAPMAME